MIEPFSTHSREQWRQIGCDAQLQLGEEQLRTIAGVGDSINISEVKDIYLPLVHFIWLYISATNRRSVEASSFLQRAVHIRPFVIAIGGSVAVGKSTVARIIQKRLADTSGLQVQIVTSDGFLYSREELQRRNLMSRKGFPESCDMRSMIDFLAKVRMGQPAQAPTYSHETTTSFMVY